MPNNLIIKMPDGTRLSLVQGMGVMGSRENGNIEVGILRSDGTVNNDPRGYVDGSQLHQILERLL